MQGGETQEYKLKKILFIAALALPLAALANEPFAVFKITEPGTVATRYIGDLEALMKYNKNGLTKQGGRFSISSRREGTS